MPLRLALAPAAAVLVLLAVVRLGPLEAPETRVVVGGTTVVDARGNVLARDAGAGLRIPVPLDRVAPVMIEATISAEDRRFYAHPGIDPLAAARALATLPWQRSGASTITQQVARRLYLADDPSPLLVRKGREALIALQLESRRAKDEILSLYLNDAYYGRGAYGVEAAARAFFGISAADLDLAHAAYLAGLPQRPSAFDPAADDTSARARQAYVLERMVADGKISREQAGSALARPISPISAAAAAVSRHFVAYALAELARLRPDLAGQPGLVVETTLDGGLQAEAERLARRQLAALDDRNATNAAVVAMEPGTGRIVAYVGGATDGDPAHGGEIDMALNPRSPGSALKPFLYAAAFERGWSAASQLLDVPTTFLTDDGAYAPFNYGRAFHGVVPLRTALASSLNVPAVRTLNAIGIEALLEIGHRFGLSTLSAPELYGLALTLGGGEVPLLDLTSAYAALAARGELAEPYAVERVRDASGRVVYERHAAMPRRVLSPEHAYLVADILSDPDARAMGFGPVAPFEVPFAAAAKTGTSTGFRDTWALGFTPEIAVGVWAGNADGSPMRDVSGAEGAGPIWRDVMSAAAFTRRMTWYDPPPGIVTATVCSPTGLLPGPDCPSPVRELFVSGTEPNAVERYYVRDESGLVAIDPPREARAWARDAGFRLAPRGAAASEPVSVLAPAGGSVFVIAPELGRQELVLRAALAAGIDRVRFEVDGRVVAEAGADDPSAVVVLEVGRHTVRAIALLEDGAIAVATSTFEVRAR